MTASVPANRLCAELNVFLFVRNTFLEKGAPKVRGGGHYDSSLNYRESAHVGRQGTQQRCGNRERVPMTA